MRFRDDLVIHRAIERLKDEWDVNAQLIFDEFRPAQRESSPPSGRHSSDTSQAVPRRNPSRPDLSR